MHRFKSFQLTASIILESSIFLSINTGRANDCQRNTTVLWSQEGMCFFLHPFEVKEEHTPLFCSAFDNKRVDVKLPRTILSQQNTKPITFAALSMHNSTVFIFTTLEELTCHRSWGILPTCLYLSSTSPHKDYPTAACSDTLCILCLISRQKTQDAEIKKSHETKEVAGGWKHK